MGVQPHRNGVCVQQGESRGCCWPLNNKLGYHRKRQCVTQATYAFPCPTYTVLWVCAGVVIRQMIAAAGLFAFSCSHLCSSDPSTETLQGYTVQTSVVCVYVGCWAVGRMGRDRVPHKLHVGLTAHSSAGTCLLPVPGWIGVAREHPLCPDPAHGLVGCIEAQQSPRCVL